MKSILIFALLAAGVWLSGCASDRDRLVLDPVGPGPPQSLFASSSAGTLIVYSAYDTGANWNARDPDLPAHSDYKIFSRDGDLLRLVHNDSGAILPAPAPVKLPAGKYRVVASANGYGRVTVTLVIQPRQITVLHLEGGGSWSSEADFNQTNTVRLPDGQVVGWRAAL